MKKIQYTIELSFTWWMFGKLRESTLWFSSSFIMSWKKGTSNFIA